MRAAMVTEYRKLVTTRLWWILLAAMAAYMGFIAAGMAWALSQGTATAGTSDDAVVISPQEVVRTVYTIAVSFGYVFPLIVGGMSFSSEFRHKTITPTLLTEPNRTVVLLAYVVVLAVVGRFTTLRRDIT